MTPRTRAGDGPAARRALLALAVGLSALLFGAPLAMVLGRALAMGWGVYVEKIADPFTLHAIWLTVTTSLIVVPINIGFGLAAAWAITRHQFPGKRLLTTLIELPVSVSPIVAGVAYLFLYGSLGVLGPFLQDQGWRIMFTVPAIWLASLFVTSPYVARELITLMRSQGADEEEAAVSLGAGGWTTFLRVTLPKIRWALFYGAVLCNARVMGEFGAVSVVSGKIRGKTETLPLHIEVLFNDYNATGAFVAASILALLALVTLALKTLAEWRLERASG
ncbi:sulfate ABC transporter permease subunit CysW [Caulobacter mirabilis]|uniref:Sulfate ABC transporter permease subunit CysW n=1 Tax=Caulobacter mirabilis TaxID=69666 RepID=A0A2D2AT59_9CAUL|nr:sulfate ABC transporter permease subunit CysW [Caulobacter mirabilis]ATQ41190.1 sulfate ABC transporter permease subunit CysW [Caulobacter mirabilis]